MSLLTLFLLIGCGISIAFSGIAEDSACKTENTCDCCSSNPDNGSRKLTDICSYETNGLICTYGCKDGHYGNLCWRKCPAKCIRCHHSVHRSSTICMTCVDGYFGHYSHCSTPCPAKCAENQCHVTTGNCLQGCTSNNWSGDKCNVCADTWYGNNCDIPCPSECKDRLCYSGGCTTGCTDDNFTGPKCDQCRVGQYSDKCHMNCPENCKNELCDRDSGACIDGCKGNFAGDRCDLCVSNYYGINCEKACLNCLNGICDRSTGICNDCDIGKFGDFCDKPCSVGCKNSVCGRYDAKCSGGCNHGFSGDKCCVVNDYCEKCDSTSTCSQCKLGHYGDSCSLGCPQYCDGGCVKESGHCYRCTNEYYGQKCAQKCSVNCYEAECLMIDGTCLSCKNGHYGRTCNNTCPDNCVNRICNQKDGMCLRCQNGYHGRSCDIECSLNCKDNLCDQDTGSCKLGCVNEEENGCDQSPQSSCYSGEIVGGLLGGIIAGFTVLTIMSHVLCFLWRRRRTQYSNQETSIPVNPTYENEPTRVTKINKSLGTKSVRMKVLKPLLMQWNNS